jgi:hypothetical protein
MTDFGSLRSPDRLGAWFCGIAFNLSRRYFRQLSGPRCPRRSRTESPGIAAEAQQRHTSEALRP